MFQGGRALRRVLIYKRTHIGDPNEQGDFGCSDCMGRVRGYKYDAVIGIGGHSWEPRSHGISGRITWVGIAPRRLAVPDGYRAPVVRFRSFRLFDSQGELLEVFAPALARYFFARNRRYFFSDGLGAEIQKDIRRVLALAQGPRRRSSPRPFKARSCPTRCRRKPKVIC